MLNCCWLLQQRIISRPRIFGDLVAGMDVFLPIDSFTVSRDAIEVSLLIFLYVKIWVIKTGRIVVYHCWTWPQSVSCS